MFPPTEQPTLYLIDDPYLPRVHRHWWKSWTARHLPAGWACRFVSEIGLRVPTEWKVKPWVGRRLAAKVGALSSPSPHPRMVVEADAVFRENLLGLSVPAGEILADRLGSLREVECLAVGAGATAVVAGDYEAAAEWWNPAIKPFSFLEGNYVSLVRREARPWLAAGTEVERVWRDLARGGVSHLTEDVRDGLVRPSLRSALDGNDVSVREAYLAERWGRFADHAPSREAIARVRSPELARRLRKFQFRRETDGLDRWASLKHGVKHFLLPLVWRRSAKV